MLKDVVNPVNTRASASGNLLVNGNSTITQETFINDATKAWNKAPVSIKESKSQFNAKKHIKDFVKTLQQKSLPTIPIIILKVST